MMFKRSLTLGLMVVFAVGVLLFLTSSTATTAQVRSVTFFSAATGEQEIAAFQAIFEAFTQASGIVVEATFTRDLPAVVTARVAAGNPMDIAALPNPGQMVELARQGALVPLDFMASRIRADHNPVWIDLGSVDGTLFGFYIGVSNKSLVWYNPKQFAAQGYKVPATWDELIALSEQIVADGKTPWCVALESGAASGWPGTDWIEDIMLRIADPEVYDQWVAHDIPWTDANVKTAWERFGQIATNDTYLYGGTTGALTTYFGDVGIPLFTDPPGCFMAKQASFITSFPGFAEHEAGVDYDFFFFPPDEAGASAPALAGGNVVVMFNDTPEARALMRFLETPAAQEVLAARIGWLSPNKNVSLNVYPNDFARRFADSLANAEIVRFDASDLMPAAVGSGSFWTGVLDYVGGTDLCEVLRTIEASADDAYTSGAATNDVVEQGAC